MAIVVDEDAGTITFTDCTITFPFGFSVSSGVGTIVITPAGGVASFPLAIQGASGLPPIISIAVHEVAPDDPLPDPNPERTVVDPGGPGEAAHYHYDVYIHKGDKGDAASFKLLDADDLADAETLRAGDSLTDGHVLSYVADDGSGNPGVVFIPQRAVTLGNAGAFNATGWSNTNPRQVATAVVAAKPWPQRVVVAGGCQVAGSADTRVDLVARLKNADTGFEVGYAEGQTGATPPPLVLMSAPPPGADLDSSASYIAAGQSGTVYLRAEQKNTTSSSWQTLAGRFAAWGVPI